MHAIVFVALESLKQGCKGVPKSPQNNVNDKGDEDEDMYEDNSEVVEEKVCALRGTKE
jgi:hypothetical protein